MFPTSRRLELFLLAILPALITFLLAIFSLSSSHVVAGLNRFMPLLALIPVFYWGMTRAREMPYWFVFLLGLLVDAVTGQPLGLSSLLYLFFLILLRTQRKYIHKEGFVLQWGYFAGLLGVICLLNWIVLSLFYTQFAALVPAIIQWLLTIGCYPLLHSLFDRLYDFTNSRRWHILQRG